MVGDTGVQIEVAAARANGQAMVEGTLSPRENAPDMAQVLGVQANAALDNAEAQENKMALEGTLSIRVLYLCREGKPHGFEAASRFKHALELPGARPGMRVKADASVSRVENSLLDGRSISVNAVLDVEGRAYESVNPEAGVSGHEGLEVQKKKIKASRCVGRAGSGFVVREDIRLPQGAEEPAEILSSNAYARVRSINADGANAAVEGDIHLNTIYRTGDNGMAQYSHAIPFGQIVPMGTLLENAELNAAANVRETTLNIVGDSLLNAEMMVHVDVNANQAENAEIVEDAYSPNESIAPNVKQVSVNGPALSGNGKATFRQTLAVPAGVSEAEKVLFVLVNPLVMGKAAEENRVNVEGVLQTQIVYAVSDGGVKSLSEDVPFKAAVDVNGVKENMDVEVDAKVEQATAALSDNQMDMKVNLDIAATGYENANVSMVESIAPAPEATKYPSGIVVYFPSEGESLWTVAKKFGTSVDNIKARNNLEESDNLGGKKIILFCPPRT